MHASALSPIALLLALGLAAPHGAQAEAIRLGSLKTANVGPAFVAKDKGYFAAEGLDVAFSYFESAQPIAVGVASRSLDFGVSATSAGMFSLAAEGQLRIIGGLYSEAPGFHNFAIAATNAAYAAGLKTYADLPGHSISISQVGSPVHYSLGLIAEKFHFDLQSLHIMPLQSIPNMMSALMGGQTDATIITATSINPPLVEGKVKLIGWIGDETPWQAAVATTSVRMIEDHPQTVERFLRAYRKGTREYHDAFAGPDGQRRDGPNAAEVLAILAKFTGQSADQVKLSVAYTDADARVDTKDIVRQVEWLKSQKMLKEQVQGAAAMDMRYVVPLPQAK
jgi:NitT/TauT family transport system substrate-binding protein